MRTRGFTVEKAKTGFWTYLQRSPGNLPKTPLHRILNWILEQLNLGHVEAQVDSSGEIVSLKLGRGIARLFKSMEGGSEETKRRLLAVYLAGIIAQCRESGIQPEHAEGPKMFSRQATDWGHRNTEFHYAFEVVRVLARLNKKTFELEAPPIGGLAPPSVVSYLRESTRCWLYGFYGACVALNRACLEDALKARLSSEGELLNLITWARRNRVLDDRMEATAHTVRKAGNDFLHGKKISEKEAGETLGATRSIVEHLFAA